MPPPKSTSQKSSEEASIQFVSQSRFHQCFTLPSTASHGALRVTYAVAGCEEDGVPTVLFIGGMFGGRWCAMMVDHLARDIGLRVVVFDRPGLGGSTPVPITQRMSVFLETVPALLKHLNVTQTVIISHSSGTIFALNALYHLPHLLSPTKPSLYLFAPWVHPNHSSVALMSVASMIPSGILNHWSSVMKFSMKNLVPSFSASAGIFGDVKDFFAPSSNSKQAQEERDKKILEHWGQSREERDEWMKCMTKDIMMAEELTGGNDEAMLCLKKSGPGLWGVADDYEKYVPLLGREMKRLFGEKRDSDGKPVRVSVKAYFAQDDVMVGEKGMQYFDHCFREANRGEDHIVDYAGRVTVGTDHDSVWLPENEAIGEVLRQAKKTLGG